MSESEHSNSIRHDPLLESDSFIGADQSGSPEYEQHQPTRSFGSISVIDAKPISMVAPDYASAEATPKAAMRRNSEEMAKSPSWLPENWKIDLKVRSSGATAGGIDRYYLDPSGRKFRSQNEVRHFLETGTRLKRKADAVPSGSSASQKRKKSGSVKRKKSEALKVDVAYPSHDLSSVHANTPQKA